MRNDNCDLVIIYLNIYLLMAYTIRAFKYQWYLKDSRIDSYKKNKYAKETIHSIALCFLHHRFSNWTEYMDTLFGIYHTQQMV